MNSWANRLALLALLGACADQTRAQSQPPDALKVIGTCVVIQTKATTVETPIGLRAEGWCETAEGGPQTCTATIG